MTSRTESFEGGCTCRHIRYRLAERPLFVHCCHCRWCQRDSGTAFAMNAMIEADRVEQLLRAVESSAGRPLKSWDVLKSMQGERRGW